jgi:hypothetical protein
MLPVRMARHRAHEAWLRELNIDLPDSSAPIAAITVRRRGVGGALKLFQKACREVEHEM